jgi:hypothetical protein
MGQVWASSESMAEGPVVVFEMETLTLGSFSSVRVVDSWCSYIMVAVVVCMCMCVTHSAKDSNHI